MIAVAVVAILTLIAVPLFSGESRKGKAKSEIGPMFAELSSKEEAYKIDNNVYLNATACPATPTAQLQDASACATTWSALRVALPQQEVRCSYYVTSGLSGATPVPPAGFTFKPAGAQAIAWYFIVATCDMDGSSGTNSSYFQGSGDGVIQIQNEGQ